MSKNKQPETSIATSVEQAWRENGEKAALEAIIIKYAKVLDMTDSGRDIKPLASGMLETIDRLNALKAANGDGADTKPVLNIIDLANKAKMQRKAE